MQEHMVGIDEDKKIILNFQDYFFVESQKIIIIEAVKTVPAGIAILHIFVTLE